jgi:alcohol dehydrogenase (cytochrome c)
MIEQANMWAGTVATAGGLVFFDDDEEECVALDARTSRYRWHCSFARNITASPMTYSLNGRQCIISAVPADVFTFGLFEPAQPARLVAARLE